MPTPKSSSSPENNTTGLFWQPPGSLNEYNLGHTLPGMNYGARLRQARHRAGLTQKELEDATGGLVKQATISKIERGDQDSSAYDPILAKALGVEAYWLSTGKGPIEPIKGEPVRAVPVLSWGNAAHRKYVDVPRHEWLGTAYTEDGGANAFALIMNDDDMDGSAGPYRIPRGARLLVDPDQTDPEALTGEPVIVTRSDGACCLRELTLQMGELVLTAWGDRVLRPVIPFEGWDIVGRMIRAEMILYQKQ